MAKKLFKQKQADVGEIVISRYSFRAWKRVYPESTRLEWLTTQQPYSISLFVEDILESIMDQMNVSSLECVKILPLDDAFTKWTDEHPEEGLAEYKVEDNEIDVIMKNEDMLHDYHLVVLPIIAISDVFKDETRTTFSLDEKTWEKIDEYFADVFRDRGFVFHYLMRIDDIYNDQEVIYTAAKAYFEDNMRVKLDKYLEQGRTNKKATIYKLGIPIVTKGSVDSGIINIPEFFAGLDATYNSPEDLMLEAAALKERGISSGRSFKDSEAFQMICNYFGEKSAVGTYLEAAYNLPAFNEEVINSFTQIIGARKRRAKGTDKKSRDKKLSTHKC